MNFLRTVSTQRLLAILAGVIIAVAGGTAIAFAATGGGAVPPREPLAQAVHQAATAPSVSGISARIKFTNNLISSSDIQGSDPILNGATGRLWLSPANHALRLELQGDNGDAQVVVDNGSFWAYDPTSNTVYKGSLPAGSSGKTNKTGSSSDQIPSVAQIQTDLNRLMQQVDLLGPLPRNIAGQPAYKVKVTPKHSGGLLGQVQLAWDAAHGVPLGIALYARGSSSPVLELKATNISFGSVKSATFAVKPPAGAKVVQVATPAGAQASGANAANGNGSTAKGKSARKARPEITGPAAVQSHLPFKLSAPAKLVGLPRQSVQLLDWSGHPAALVTYGRGLGGIAVIQQQSQSQTSSQQPSQSQNGGDQRGLTLPTVSINGATGHELATALGTALQFSSGGISYTVLGSVPPTAAEAAAKGLVH